MVSQDRQGNLHDRWGRFTNKLTLSTGIPTSQQAFVSPYDASPRTSTVEFAHPDPVSQAQDLVRREFPHALGAVLGGSSARGTATPTSDLDIVVVLDGPPAPFRSTIMDRGRPVELFVHTLDSISDFKQREREKGQHTLAHILSTGTPLGGPLCEKIQQEARLWTDEGPIPWTPQQVAYARYALTDVLDDLVDCRDADERGVIASQAYSMATALALNNRGAWQGNGKWQLRFLKQADSDLGGALSGAYRSAVSTGNVRDLLAVCESVLNEVGGRLTEGFKQS